MKNIKLTALLLPILFVLFSCSKESNSDPYVLFSATEYSVNYNTDSTYVRVQCNDASWVISQDSGSKEWATLVGPTTGKANRDVLIKLTSNESYINRVAQFYVTFTIDGKEEVLSAKLIQAPRDRYITPASDTLFFDAQGEVLSTTIESNVDWDIVNLASYSWVSNQNQKLDSVSNDSIRYSTLEVEVEQNPNLQFRVASLKIQMRGSSAVSNNLYLYQYGSGTVKSDSLALVDCYNALGGGSWSNKWDLTQPINSWYGVKVAQTYGGERVVSLNLSKNNLVGTLPTDRVATLSYLTELSLYGNNIEGVFNDDLTSFYDMRFFYLYDNAFTGSIPATVANMEKLIRFRVENNQLSGSIPAQFGTLSSLTLLSLNGNNFTGNLPSLLGDLEGLKELNVSENRLSGVIPTSYTLNDNWFLWSPETNIILQQEGYGLIVGEK